MIIYKITNLINGKIYIGKSESPLQIRWKKHLDCARKKVNRYLYDAMNHYGIENFKIECMEKCENKQTLNEREKFWIKHYNSMNKKLGYNMQEGGIRGKQPDEVRKRAGEKRLGISWGHHSVEIRERLRQLKTGKNNPAKRPEVRKKISDTLKEKYKKGLLKINIPKVEKGENHPRWHIPHTKQAKRRMCLARKGRTYEEIYGMEKAKEMRGILKEKWKGEKNPNYKNVPKEELLKIILSKRNVGEMANHFSVAKVTIFAKSHLYFNKTPMEIKGELR